jgi:oligopeptide/dipeptide ABC transporter ATP-binding protein
MLNVPREGLEERMKEKLDSKLLSVREARMYFPVYVGSLTKRKIGDIRAVDGVSVDVERSSTLGVVGESGSGKTTLTKLMLGVYRPTSGNVFFEGIDIARAGSKEIREIRKKIGVILQDPISSLDPRMKVYEIVSEPLDINTDMSKEEKLEKVTKMIERVGLKQEDIFKYPSHFSGGQRQRIAIARSLVLDPELVIADEPVSSLDVTVQSRILNLLKKVQRERKISFVFVSHDLNVVRWMSDEVVVMYLGKVVEQGPADTVYSKPLHPYTVALLSSIPTLEQGKTGKFRSAGEPPSPLSPPSGCRFRTRCPFATDLCVKEEPKLINVGDNHYVACHFYDKIEDFLKDG